MGSSQSQYEQNKKENPNKERELKLQQSKALKKSKRQLATWTQKLCEKSMLGQNDICEVYQPCIFMKQEPDELHYKLRPGKGYFTDWNEPICESCRQLMEKVNKKIDSEIQQRLDEHENQLRGKQQSQKNKK